MSTDRLRIEFEEVRPGVHRCYVRILGQRKATFLVSTEMREAVESVFPAVDTYTTTKETTDA